MIITTHGAEERIGRLNEPDQHAIPDKTPSDPARSHGGNRQLIRSPSSGSTRSGEIPVTRESDLIEREQRRGQRRGFTETGPDRCAICAQLGQARIAITKRPQDGDEEKRLAEDPPAREAKRISHPAVAMFVGQERSSSASVSSPTVRRDT